MKINEKILTHIKNLRIELINASSDLEEDIQKNKLGLQKREEQLKNTREELQSLDEILKVLDIPVFNQLPWVKKD
jgi:hypothetical protein